MKERKAQVARKTGETDITVKLNLDGTGTAKIAVSVGMLAHMLESLSRHSAIDIDLKAAGDTEVDQHHLVEDIGIVLGDAVRKALGDKLGINRAGFFVFPMDEALGVVALDIGGRAQLQYEAKFKRRFCGELDTDTLPDLFGGFAQGLMANVAVRAITGRSDHHKLEALFKAFAKALKLAVSRDARLKEYLPSTKGAIR
ncbi:MAG TPA: imidazoleglycerol-phosphate dehydratase HisB [bacterium]|nr:imidazoleglycerol-phosphate dehydratase HisB [bacterium]